MIDSPHSGSDKAELALDDAALQRFARGVARLDRIRFPGYTLTGAVGALLALAYVKSWVFPTTPENFNTFWVVLLGAAPSIAFGLWRKHRAEVLRSDLVPRLARAAGMTHTTGAADLLQLVQNVGGLPSGKPLDPDSIRGTAAGHPFRMDLLKIETGGKNSRTVWEGLIFSTTAPVGLPDFVLRPARGKLARAILEPLGGNRPLPLRHDGPLPDPLSDFALFHREADEISAALPQIVDLAKRLGWPRALILRDGRLILARGGDANRLRADLAGLTEREILSSMTWIAGQFRIPLDLLSAIHDAPGGR